MTLPQRFVGESAPRSRCVNQRLAPRAISHRPTGAISPPSANSASGRSRCLMRRSLATRCRSFLRRENADVRDRVPCRDEGGRRACIAVRELPSGAVRIEFPTHGPISVQPLDVGRLASSAPVSRRTVRSGNAHPARPPHLIALPNRRCLGFAAAAHTGRGGGEARPDLHLHRVPTTKESGE